MDAFLIVFLLLPLPLIVFVGWILILSASAEIKNKKMKKIIIMEKELPKDTNEKRFEENNENYEKTLDKTLNL